MKLKRDLEIDLFRSKRDLLILAYVCLVGAKPRWKKMKEGSKKKGVIYIYEHLFGFKIFLYLFHPGTAPTASAAEPTALGVATRLQSLWASLSPTLGIF